MAFLYAFMNFFNFGFIRDFFVDNSSYSSCSIYTFFSDIKALSIIITAFVKSKPWLLKVLIEYLWFILCLIGIAKVNLLISIIQIV